MQKLRYRGIKELQGLTGKWLNLYLNQSACPESTHFTPTRLSTPLAKRILHQLLPHSSCPLQNYCAFSSLHLFKNCHSSFPSFASAPVPFSRTFLGPFTPPIMYPSFTFLE